MRNHLHGVGHNQRPVNRIPGHAPVSGGRRYSTVQLCHLSNSLIDALRDACLASRLENRGGGHRTFGAPRTTAGAHTMHEPEHHQVRRPHAVSITESVRRLLAENPGFRIDASEDSPAAIGATAHAVIAILAPIADQFTTRGLTEVVLGLARGMCAPGYKHRRNSTLVAGFANEYLRGPARPRAPWVFANAEQRLATGVVDLVWRHTGTGVVFFDEIKTTRVGRRSLPNTWREKATDYASAGAELFGDLFVGVRIVPLGSMNVASLVTPDGTVRALGRRGSDALAVTA